MMGLWVVAAAAATVLLLHRPVGALLIKDTSFSVVLANIPFESSFQVEYEEGDFAMLSSQQQPDASSSSAVRLYAELFRVTPQDHHHNSSSSSLQLLHYFNQSIWQDSLLTTTFTFADAPSLVLARTGKHTLLIRASLALDNSTDTTSPPPPPASAQEQVWVISGFTTLLPLFLIMLIAVVFQSVLPALFLGVWFAAFLLYENDVWLSFARTWDTVILGALTDRGNQLVILFVMTTAGLIEMVNHSQGSRGLANVLSTLARSPKSAQTVALLFGCVLFFDDYASALIVGGTMGPVTDRCFVSREKLAFIVDSGAAPIAALIPITSWTAFESSLLQTEANKLTTRGVQFAELGYEESGFMGLLRMLQFAYYSIFLLFFQLVIIASGREFGPMFTCERLARMRECGDVCGSVGSEMTIVAPVLPSGVVGGDKPAADATNAAAAAAASALPPKCRNGFFPIAFFIVLVLVLLVSLGAAAVPETEEVAIDNIFANVDSISVMLYAATISCFAAALFYRVQCLPVTTTTVDDDNAPAAPATWRQRLWCTSGRFRPLMTLSDSLQAFTKGFSHLTPTVMILVLAWAMGAAIDALGAGRYFASSLQGNIAPQSLPALIFCISSVVSYSTGSSWGSMALMYPICGPVAFQLSQIAATTTTRSSSYNQQLAVDLYYCSMAAILEGSVFGAHCSFICDTTIMSSMACECAIAQHVKTQVPYAIFNAGLSLVVGFALVGAVPIPVTYLLGFALIVLGVHALGAKPHMPGTLDRVSRWYCLFQLRVLKRKEDDISILRTLREHQLALEASPLSHAQGFVSLPPSSPLQQFGRYGNNNNNNNDGGISI